MQGTVQPWTAEELAILKAERLKGTDYSMLVQLTHHSYGSVHTKVKELLRTGEITTRTGRPWTEADDEIVKARLPKEAAILLNRPLRHIYARRSNLHLPALPRTYQAGDLDLVVALRQKGQTAKEIAQQVNRPETVINGTLSRLVTSGKLPHLTTEERHTRRCRAWVSHRVWTVAERETIQALWVAGLTAREITERVGGDHTIAQVNCCLTQLKKTGTIPKLTSEEHKAHHTRWRTAKQEKADQQWIDRLRAQPDHNLGYIVGVLYGDGFIVRNDHTVGLKTTNKSFADSFTAAITAWFGVEPKRYQRLENKKIGTYTYHDVLYYEVLFCRATIGRAILHVFGDTRTFAWQINIEQTLAFGEAFACGLVQGLVDSEGSVETDRRIISVASSHRPGLESLQQLLEKLGYDVSLYDSKTRATYRLTLYGEVAARYAKNIGSRIDVTQGLLQQLIVRQEHTRGYNRRGGDSPSTV
jgi:hypothetical protein